jgi:hypothetical protein
MSFPEDLVDRAIMTSIQYAHKGVATAAICSGAGDQTVTCVLGGNTTSDAFVLTSDLDNVSTDMDYYILVMP